MTKIKRLTYRCRACGQLFELVLENVEPLLVQVSFHPCPDPKGQQRGVGDLIAFEEEEV